MAGSYVISFIPNLEAPTMRHPAKFSKPILEILEELAVKGLVLDPFAGTGRIHRLASDSRFTVGVELEPEWAELDHRTLVGNALHLPFPDDSFDAIITSPVYGNRMSDHHNAKDDSVRNTYKHTLGSDLHPDNSGQLHWGPKYREFHLRAWSEASRVLKPYGQFILNISNFIKKGEEQEVSEWHLQQLIETFGYTLQDSRDITTERNRYGANRDLRVAVEHVFDLRASGSNVH